MAGGVINTGSHPKLLWPGVRATWGQVYEAYQPKYIDLYDQLDSDKAYEQDVMVTPFGMAPVKEQGAPVTYDSQVQGFITTYNHVAYALGYIVTYEELRDNLYEEVSMRRAKANAFSINQTIETVAAFLYNNAFSNTYFTMPDGQPLISQQHMNVSGGTFSNGLFPSVDLSETAIEDMITQIRLAQNDRGLTIAIEPRSLIISPQQWWNANRILKSVLQSTPSGGSITNNINVLRAENALPEGIKMNPFLSPNPNAWFMRTNIPNGMQQFWRDRPRFDRDNDFDTMNAKAATYMRFSVGCTDPRGLYGSNGP
jgi:hypothetical protein